MTDACVLALLTDARDRELIVKALDRYEVVTGDNVIPIAEGRGFDVVVVDERRFRDHREELAAQKEESDPVYLPYLLVLSETSIDDIGAEVWEEVDDVIDAPVRQEELEGRLDTLVRAREYSNELREQNQRLDRFASVISHDLRNPLNVAQANVELVRGSDEPDTEELERAGDALDRIDQLVDDVLTLARHGEGSLDRERVVLGVVAEEAWRNVETMDATLSVADDLGIVSGDEGQLMELFENLFRNSVEHGSTGSRNAERSDDSVEHAGDDVTVTVTATADGFAIADDGTGIPSDEREKVFDQGYSGADGTGLGLSIVETIVDAHGWEIGVVESESGGARFEISVD